MWQRGDVLAYFNEYSGWAVVAVVGQENDFTARTAEAHGYWDLDDVERFGDKMDEKAARGLFPQLADLKYRP